MDVPVQKKTLKNKWLIYVAGLVASIMLVFVFIRQSASQLNVSKTTLNLSEVTRGNFEDMVILAAQSQSLHSSLINVPEGGAVKEIYAEDGQMVHQGQRLALLSDPNAEFNYLDRENSIEQQITQIRTNIINIRSQQAAREKEMLQEQNEYNMALQQYNLQKRLFESEIGRKIDYDMSVEKWSYEKKRLEFSKANYARDTRSSQTQEQELNKAICNMQQSLSTLKVNRNNFLITAGTAGRLSSFSISQGQNIKTGESIGKIDLMDGYKLVAKVDEFYLNKLKNGIPGTLESNDRQYKVYVSKVLPEITAGQFLVEFLFSNAVPANMQIGMSFSVKLLLSASTTSLLIDKGNFIKETSGKWIFVVEGNKAVRRNIVLGRENMDYYEVVQGLSAGEKVIISDYERMQKFETLNLQ